MKHVMSAGDGLVLLAEVIQICAGILTLVAVLVAARYVMRPTRLSVRGYWIVFWVVIAANALLLCVDWSSGYGLDFWKRAVTAPPHNPVGPRRDDIENLNVIVPFGLFVFFSAPWIRRYLEKREQTRRSSPS
jgi:hypothetical protein